MGQTDLVDRFRGCESPKEKRKQPPHHIHHQFKYLGLPSEDEVVMALASQQASLRLLVFPEVEDEAEDFGLWQLLRLTIQKQSMTLNKTKRVTANVTPTMTSAEVAADAFEVDNKGLWGSARIKDTNY